MSPSLDIYWNTAYCRVLSLLLQRSNFKDSVQDNTRFWSRSPSWNHADKMCKQKQVADIISRERGNGLFFITTFRQASGKKGKYIFILSLHLLVHRCAWISHLNKIMREEITRPFLHLILMDVNSVPKLI